MRMKLYRNTRLSNTNIVLFWALAGNNIFAILNMLLFVFCYYFAPRIVAEARDIANA